MRGRRVALGVVVVVGLLVGTQLAYTAVGQVVGPHWDDPATVASVESDPDTFIADMAADGNSAGGAVAWIERDGQGRSIQVARVATHNGSVTVGDGLTVARRAPNARGVDVAVGEEDIVVTWERSVADQVVLARITGMGEMGTGADGEGDGQPASDRGQVDRRVIADPFRVTGTSVTLTPQAPVVAYTAIDNATDPFEVRAAAVDPGGTVTRQQVGGPTHTAHEPTMASAGDRLAVVWWHAPNKTTMVSTGQTTAMSESMTVDSPIVAGTARVRGRFSGSTRDVPFVTGARTEGTIRPTWTDVGTVTTAPLDTDRSVGDPLEVGDGGQPGIAARGDQWLLAWVTPRGGTGDDVVFQAGDGTTGVLSQYTSKARWPQPVYAPAPAVAWVEWAGTDRVLVSTYRADPQGGIIARLTADPQRFAFLTLAGLAIGLVTVPIMPWSFVGLFGAFVLTTGIVTSRVLRGGTWLGAKFGRETTVRALRRRLARGPAILWVTVFGVVQTPLVVYFLITVPRLRAFGFAHPVGISAGALLAAVVFVAAGRVRSNWLAIITFVCLQNAALWVIAVTSFL